ncbi:MAG: LacI family DNA-binding transcriptional regulator [Candidatus Omnitrophica bacterium]|nr:LacI family DNA-binding transcriptional regulator [Candidatus Omnitrophota bacterium]
MTNIRDIAKEAKVSVATVSRLLDPEKNKLVHPETREKVEKIIRKRRYTPNRTAQALSRQTTNTIGMVTAFSSDVVKSPYFEGLIAGIIEGIGPLSYDLKWIMIRDEERNSCKLHDMLRKHSVDGVIFLTWRLLTNLVEEIQHRIDVPSVLINDYDPKVHCSIVYCENKSGVAKIFSHFISKGHKKIGMIRGPEYISHDARGRFLAFKASAKKMGIPLKDSFFRQCHRFEEEAGYETMASWIRAGGLPDAIFCANDDLAAGAVRALREKKIKVPQDIAIAGYDDSQRHKMSIPFLTSVRQPLEAMGRASVETLIKLISKEAKGAIRLKFEPELIVRDSA